jgi:hypothetical protein
MIPATDKHYTAAIIERRDFSEDLWLIRVDPEGHSSLRLDIMQGLHVRGGLLHTRERRSSRVGWLKFAS